MSNQAADKSAESAELALEALAAVDRALADTETVEAALAESGMLAAADKALAALGTADKASGALARLGEPERPAWVDRAKLGQALAMAAWGLRESVKVTASLQKAAESVREARAILARLARRQDY